MNEVTNLLKERAVLRDARRVVVKVGTHSIAKKTGRPDGVALRRVVNGVCELHKAGMEVFFVSSGAVAAGVEALGLTARPTEVSDVQMCAAVGQARFISEYEKLFAARGVKIGQLLLTHSDFADRRRVANLRRSFDHLVRAGIVPVINENDIVADEELRGLAFSDNDWLASLIVKLVHADALVLLTTVDGLFDAEGRRVPAIGKVRDALRLVHPGEKGTLSKGGMDSKLKAVQNAARSGANVVIANAAQPHVLAHVFAGRDVGTFVPGCVL
ncbi:MAG: glutamate 5-kinase [Kiritimatiellia bacterium]